MKITTAHVEPITVQLPSANSLEAHYLNNAPIRQHPMSISIKNYQQMLLDSDIRIPDYQRDSIYSDEWASLLFFSIMHQASIGLIEVAQRRSNEGDVYYDLINGLQRTNCLARIIKGSIPLPTDKLLAKSIPGYTISLIAPGMTLPQLSTSLQSDFWSYMLKLNVSENIPIEQQWQYFILTNNQKSPTAGEKLWAYHTPTNDYAKAMQKYSCWDAIYRGNWRKNRHMAALGLIGLELLPTGSYYVQLRDDELYRIASGYYDHLLNDMLKKRIERRMEQIEWLFRGLRENGRVSIIPMSQAARILEENGKDVFAIPPVDEIKGGLVPWITRQKLIKPNNSHLSYSVIAHLADHVLQQKFWEQLGQKNYLLAKYPQYS